MCRNRPHDLAPHQASRIKVVLQAHAFPCRLTQGIHGIDARCIDDAGREVQDE